MGHARTAYWRHSSRAGSLSTGCRMSERSTAARTVAGSASCGNFGEWIPITVRTSACDLSAGRNSSSTCRQLPQQDVQKSSRTKRPRRPARVSGAGTLNQSPDTKRGARTRGPAPTRATSSPIADRLAMFPPTDGGGTAKAGSRCRGGSAPATGRSQAVSAAARGRSGRSGGRSAAGQRHWVRDAAA